MQGYLFGRPMPEEDFLAHLTTTRPDTGQGDGAPIGLDGGI
jgi:sensor c-di-GMP phosphodiesterase-like protein